MARLCDRFGTEDDVREVRVTVTSVDSNGTHQVLSCATGELGQRGRDQLVIDLLDTCKLQTAEARAAEGLLGGSA